MPFELRRITRNNQITIPRAFLRAVAGNEYDSAIFKITIDQKLKTINMELTKWK